MGHSVSHIWHQVERPVGKAITTVGHDVGGAVRHIPLIGKPIAKLAHASAAYTLAPVEFLSPKIGSSLAGYHGAAAQRYHRLTNIGTAVVATVATGGLASGALGGGGAASTGALGFGGQAQAAAMAAGGGTFTDVGAGGVLSSTAVGSGGFLSDLGAGASNLAGGVGSFFSGAGGYIGAGLTGAKNLLMGNKTKSGGGIASYLEKAYGYISGHGGVLGLAGSGLSSVGRGAYSGAGQVFNGLGRGAQYAGGFLGGSKTQQYLQGMSISHIGGDLKALEARFSGNSKISGLQNQLSFAKLKGLIMAQGASQGAQMTPASSPVIVNTPAASAPIQAGFGGSPIEIILIVGVFAGMFMFIKGKK